MNGGNCVQNKDITSKIFAEALKEKSFAVYGVETPRVKEIWSTNLPRIAVNELRMDNLFLLEDDTLAIFDYESKYEVKSKIKYVNYVNRVLGKLAAGEKLSDEDIMRLTVLPLAVKGKKPKEDMVEKAIFLAKKIQNDEQ